MRAKKSLGQNFLMHPRIAERIVLTSGVTEDDTVLEIGPGTGMLTRALLAKAGKVLAVEADRELLPHLEETFADDIAAGKLTLMAGDIREFDPNTIKGAYHLVANIPYYITGEIFRKFLTATHKPSSMALLVQKEVAVRIARSAKESLLSLSVKAFGTPEYCFTVPRGAFWPAPGVDSAVLAVRSVSGEAFASPAEEQRFFELLRAGFAHKRKRLAKNLEDVADAGAIAEAFAGIGLLSTVRAEDLPLSAWLSLARAMPVRAKD